MEKLAFEVDETNKDGPDTPYHTENDLDVASDAQISLDEDTLIELED